MVNPHRNVTALVEHFWALWILIWKPKISLMWKLNRTTVGLGKLADQKILQTKGGCNNFLLDW